MRTRGTGEVDDDILIDRIKLPTPRPLCSLQPATVNTCVPRAVSGMHADAVVVVLGLCGAAIAGACADCGGEIWAAAAANRVFVSDLCSALFYSFFFFLMRNCSALQPFFLSVALCSTAGLDLSSALQLGRPWAATTLDLALLTQKLLLEAAAQIPW